MSVTKKRPKTFLRRLRPRCCRLVFQAQGLLINIGVAYKGKVLRSLFYCDCAQCWTSSVGCAWGSTPTVTMEPACQPFPGTEFPLLASLDCESCWLLAGSLQAPAQFQPQMMGAVAQRCFLSGWLFRCVSRLFRILPINLMQMLRSRIYSIHQTHLTFYSFRHRNQDFF